MHVSCQKLSAKFANITVSFAPVGVYMDARPFRDADFIPAVGAGISSGENMLLEIRGFLARGGNVIESLIVFDHEVNDSTVAGRAHKEAR